MYFIRAVAFVNMYQQAMKLYDLQEHQLSIPRTVFENLMTLVPISELNKLYQEMAVQTQDQDFVLKTVSQIRSRELGAIGRWMFSGHDLASTIRRINYGSNCLQSGIFLSSTQNGKIIKWRYDNSVLDNSVRTHDGVRVAAFLLNVLRIYLGESYIPKRVLFSGNHRNKKDYEAYFGCEVGWNHHCTELWFHSDVRLASMQSEVLPKKRLAMSLQELDEFLNMPQPEDELKVVYELIQYSCHYGLPKVAKVAEFLGLSEQQFQRMLRKQGLNFSTVCAFVLTNTAANLLLLSIPIEQVAQRLGYTNVESFNRMFKKQRGLTPQQYQQKFHDPF
ncbi:AraC family transcriptional regulator [Vibrio aphrogenes]|uniref:AraC family transcriptional regulator n=1 Tax=Vibrio aphrogenes TaxID=1891186 RepID=UPI001E4AD166|nr:AraC family transcriptional regulator [Vibrio aphrogenes]